MNPNIVIKPITEADSAGFRDAVDAVAQERLFLRRFQGPSLEGARAFVQSNIAFGNPQFVAIMDKRVIGWCDIVRGIEDGENHLGELGMGVVAPWRGQGIGRKLIEETLAAADALGFLRVQLSVHADNERAIDLYGAMGFEHEGLQRRARNKPDGFVDVMLMARLAPKHLWTT